MRIFLVIFCSLIISCNTKKPVDHSLVKKLPQDTLKSKLLGYWGGLQSNQPVWKITDDSIEWLQENKTYPYKIVTGDMIIDREDLKLNFSNISIVADTFIFYPHGENSQTRAFRIKTPAGY